jgi:hypothetical protein
MKNVKRVFMAVALGALVLFPLSARAQPVDPLPFEVLRDLVDQEIQDRTNADQALQDQIEENAEAIASQRPRFTVLNYRTSAEVEPPVFGTVLLRDIGTFTKQLDDTIVKLDWHDDVSLVPPPAPLHNPLCTFILKIDDLDFFNFGASHTPSAGVSVPVGLGDDVFRVVESVSVHAILSRLPAGEHTLSLWVRAGPEGTICEVNGGGNERAALIEEIAADLERHTIP